MTSRLKNTDKKQVVFGFFDLVVLLTKSHRLLIIGPLLVGLVVFISTWNLPPEYDFEVVAVIAEESLSDLAGERTLDNVILKKNLQISNAELADKISYTGIAAARRLALRWGNLEDGESILQAILTELRETSEIRHGEQILKLQSKISVGREQLTAVGNMQEILLAKASELRVEASELESSALAQALGITMENKEKYADLLQGLITQLDILQKDGTPQPGSTVVVTPTTAERYVLLKILPYLSALSTLMVLLVFVFVREGLRDSQGDLKADAKPK